MKLESKNVPGAVTFEAAMERLEGIVEQMESAQMPLDELLVRFEEGNHLVSICQEKLKAAEQRIEIVTRKTQAPAAAPESTATPLINPDNDVSLF